MKAPSQRQLRVGEELRHALAWMLERGEVHDPGLQGIPVTVTEVSVSPDMHNATVFVVALGGRDTDAVVEALTRARAFLRQRISQNVKLRYVPALHFRADVSFDAAQHLEDLLKDPHVAQDLKPDEDDHGA